MMKTSMNEKDEIVIPLMKGLAFPLEKLFSRIKVFLVLAGVVSLVYSVVVFFMGQNYFCLFRQADTLCFESGLLSAISIVLWLFGLAFFINRWYLCVYCRIPVCEALKMLCWKKDFKTLGFIVAYFGLWLVIGIVFYLLRKRIPSSEWLIELSYFVLGSFFVIAALILLSNVVVFMRYLRGKQWLVFKQTIGPVFDNIYKVIAFFMFYLFLFIVLVQQVKVMFWSAQLLPIWLNGVLISFFDYCAVCAAAVCFIASLEFQETYIFREKEINQA